VFRGIAVLGGWEWRGRDEGKVSRAAGFSSLRERKRKRERKERERKSKEKEKRKERGKGKENILLPKPVINDAFLEGSFGTSTCLLGYMCGCSAVLNHLNKSNRVTYTRVFSTL